MTMPIPVFLPMPRFFPARPIDEASVIFSSPETKLN